MQCAHCHSDNPESAKFCLECGDRFDSACERCGARLPVTAKFCMECGAPVGQVAAHDDGAYDVRAPRSYTPKHLAEQILTSKSAIEGSRKQVTVLFADVKESMALAESVDPEEWHEILNEFFTILSNGVHKFEGTVNQYTGDGIMALFGAPIAHEDHAQRACFAALDLNEELERYADRLRRTKGLNFSVRMGLNSGEVVVGKIGDDLRMDYTAKGHAVGLAARMENLAAPNKVYLTEYTAALVDGYLDVRDLGAFEIKGVSRPLHVYELEGVGTFRSRLDASRRRGFSRFVGRESEMKTLEAALEEVAEGKGQAVGIVAEAGSGKSRLCYEFAERCRARGIEVIEAHCVPHGHLIPFLPIVELLRGVFKITDVDDDRSARERVAGKLLLLDEGLKDSVPFVFEFMGIADPDRPAPDVDIEIRRRLMYTCMEKMFACDQDCRPEVILFEDLHWMDEDSAKVLDEIVAMLPRTRTLLLMNYRPEHRAAWGRDHAFREIVLEPLGSEAIDALLADLLGNDPTITGLAGRIREHTAGNPFFTEEVVLALADAGTLTGTKGAYRLGGPVSELILPATIQGILGARIDRLGEDDKGVLDTAAVIGKEFDEAILRHVTGLAPDALGSSLARLADGDFVYEKSRKPQQRWAFKHPLVQEVTYHGQLGEQRKRIHRRVAEALAELYGARIEEFLALVAHHWWGAGDALEAARWRTRAAEQETGRDATAALRHWKRVRELLEEIEPCDEGFRLGLDARIAILEESWKAGMPQEELARVFAEGMELAGRCNCGQSRARLLAAMGMAKNFAGELTEARDYLTRALEIVEGSGDEALIATLKGRLAYNDLLAGHLHECLSLADEVIAGGGRDSLYARAFHAWPLLYLGELDRGKEDLEQALQLVDGQNLPGTLGVIHGAYVTYGWFAGEAEAALSHAQAQLEIAERTRSVTMSSGARDSMGVALVMNGRFGEAVTMLEQALAIVREKSAMLQGEPVMLCNLSAAYLGAGDRVMALRAAEDALKTARTRGTRMHQVRALLFHARALLCEVGRSDFGRIEKELSDACAIVELSGARSYEPFVRESMAEFARLSGDETGAARERAEAVACFRAIGARGHVARLDATVTGSEPVLGRVG